MRRLSNSDILSFSAPGTLSSMTGSLRRIRRHDLEQVAYLLANEVKERRGQDDTANDAT